MNRKQLIFVVGLGILLALLATSVLKKQSTPYTETAKEGAKLLAGFDPESVASVTIKKDAGTVTLTKKNDLWVVAQRGDYPANFETIKELLTKLWDLKVARPVNVGASRLPALELSGPDKGSTLMELKDAGGKTLQSVLLGAKSMKKGGAESDMMGGGGWPDGRYVMVGGDIHMVALIVDPLASVEPAIEPWLSKDFFKVENVKAIAVTYPQATNSWKITRDSESAPWQLAGAQPEEKLDAGKTGSLPNALSYPSFTDVALDVKPEASGLDHPTEAVLETTDGFTYTLKAAKKGEDSYYLQVGVTGDFPKEREADKEEKPEDKARLDKEFKDKLTARQEKLKNEQALGKWTYVVTKWTLDALLKDRKDLLTDTKAEPKKEGAEGAPSVPGMDLQNLLGNPK